jgi:hypothetical protein
MSARIGRRVFLGAATTGGAILGLGDLDKARVAAGIARRDKNRDMVYSVSNH